MKIFGKTFFVTEAILKPFFYIMSNENFMIVQNFGNHAIKRLEVGNFRETNDIAVLEDRQVLIPLNQVNNAKYIDMEE